MRIADDFGLGRNHDQIILSLLEAKQIDGTSVMVNPSIDPEMISRLKLLRLNGAQIGLHLNLTHRFTNGSPRWSLRELLLQMPTARFSEHIKSEFLAQVNEFVSLFGSLPDYYDGHQHCHCFPAVVSSINELPQTQHSWVRVPLPYDWSGRILNIRSGGLKTVLIMAMALRAKGIFSRSLIKTNHDFTGFLRLDKPENVQKWLPKLLENAKADCLIMLHPGAAEDSAQCIGHNAQSRLIEFQILSRKTIS